MKHFTLLATLLAIFSLPLHGAETLSGSDSRIFIEGRVLREGGTVSFDWSGVTLRINFTGTSLEMGFSDTKHSYFNVWVDEEISPKHQRVLETVGEGTMSIVSGLKRGNHSVILQKRSEGGEGRVTVSSLTTDGKFLQASDPFTRHIEFIGDSYTCGYGTETPGKSDPFRVEEENCNLTYAAIAGRYFDAGIRLISHSGKGVIRNFNGGQGMLMPEKYTRMFDDESKDTLWTAGVDGFRPDIVVIYLGTNDFSRGNQPTLGSWCQAYARLLGKVRQAYGKNVPILCVASKINELMGMYVCEAVRRSGMRNVYWTDVQNEVHNSTSEIGSNHPNYSGHRKVASCVIPYISTITGWDMPFKTVE